MRLLPGSRQWSWPLTLYCTSIHVEWLTCGQQLPTKWSKLSSVMKWLDWVNIAAPCFYACVPNIGLYAVKQRGAAAGIGYMLKLPQEETRMLCRVTAVCMHGRSMIRIIVEFCTLSCFILGVDFWGSNQKRMASCCRKWRENTHRDPTLAFACMPCCPRIRQRGAGATGRPVTHRSEATMLPS